LLLTPAYWYYSPITVGRRRPQASRFARDLPLKNRRTACPPFFAMPHHGLSPSAPVHVVARSEWPSMTAGERRGNLADYMYTSDLLYKALGWVAASNWFYIKTMFGDVLLLFLIQWHIVSLKGWPFLPERGHSCPQHPCVTISFSLPLSRRAGCVNHLTTRRVESFWQVLAIRFWRIGLTCRSQYHNHVGFLNCPETYPNPVLLY